MSAVGWTKPFVEEPDGLSYKDKKRRLIRACGPVCACCDRKFPKRKLQLDHLVPRTDGGSDNLTNMCLLCGPCNSMKSNRFTITECRRRYRALSSPDVWPGVLDRVARCARVAAGADAALDSYRYRDRSRAARDAREYAQETISALSVALSDAAASIFKHSALVRYAERHRKEQKALVTKALPPSPRPEPKRDWTQDEEYQKAKAERAAATKAERDAEAALEAARANVDEALAAWQACDDDLASETHCLERYERARDALIAAYDRVFSPTFHLPSGE